MSEVAENLANQHERIRHGPAAQGQGSLGKR